MAGWGPAWLGSAERGVAWLGTAERGDTAQVKETLLILRKKGGQHSHGESGRNTVK